MRLQLAVQYASTLADLPPKAAVTAWARAAFAGFEAERVELGVRIVDEPEGAALNQRYRAKSGPTNVLSFGLDPLPDGSACYTGDLVICAPVVRREAAEQGKPETAHWAHMVVHGILHLRGYDHVADHDADVMEDLEVRVLGRLGFPNPYSEV